MSKDAKSPNGHKPPEELHFERTPVTCPRCKRPFEHIYYEVINGLVQLRCENALFTKAHITCIRCGQPFSWNINDKDLERMAVAYGELARKIPYVPE